MQVCSQKQVMLSWIKKQRDFYSLEKRVGICTLGMILSYSYFFFTINILFM